MTSINVFLSRVASTQKKVWTKHVKHSIGLSGGMTQPREKVFAN